MPSAVFILQTEEQIAFTEEVYMYSEIW